MKNLYPSGRKTIIFAFLATFLLTAFSEKAAAQTAVAFTTSSPSLSVCAGSSATSINSLLAITDPDIGEGLIWYVNSNPSHGTLGGFNIISSTNGSTVTPIGLTYTPTPGYSGSDAFTISVDDDFFTATVTVTVTVNALPTITLGSNPAVCNGTTSANLTYSATTNSPNQYSLAWSAAGIIAGFTNRSLTTLPASPITITVPSNPGAGTYSGTLTVKNTSTGCSSTGNVMNVQVRALPTITLGSNPSVCNGTTSASLTYSATTNSPNQYQIAWSAAGIIAGFGNVSLTSLPASPITITVPSNPGSGTYGGTLTVKNSTTGCSSTGSAMNVQVKALPTITLGSNPSVCNGITSANLTYSATTNSPNQYQVAWSAAGIIAGFSNVALTTLPASPISLTVPSNPGAGTYGGTLTVKNTTSGCSSTGSAMSVTVNNLSLVSSNSNQTQDAAVSSGYYNSSGCNVIANVQPSGASPVSGNVTAKIWIEPSVPTQLGRPYVARHYEITPATNASTSTGTVTLYFLQSEFDAFNATSAALKLPTGPSDATGKSNLMIGKYSGTSSDNSGLPATYNSGSIVIDPADANIVWNATSSRWEVTFNVSGFSGFIAQTSLFTLPVTWTSFTAERSGEKVLLKWQTANETNTSHFDIEHSLDGQSFQSVGSISAAGNSNSHHDYSFTHDATGAGTHYYRIKQVDRDGQNSFSETRKISFNGSNTGFIIMANPVRNGSLQVQFDKAGMAIIYDATGHVRARKQTNAGIQSMDVSNLPKGVYLLKALGETKKFIIE